MKKILLAFVLIVSVCSCGRVYYQEKSTLLDLREYSGDNDFVIYPTNISNGDFTPLGTLELAFMTGNSVKKDMRKYVEEKNLGCGSYRYVPTVKRMVSKAVEEAKSLGANGIISFEIKRVHDVKKNNSDMDTYYVTGIPVIYKK